MFNLSKDVLENIQMKFGIEVALGGNVPPPCRYPRYSCTIHCEESLANFKEYIPCTVHLIGPNPTDLQHSTILKGILRQVTKNFRLEA